MNKYQEALDILLIDNEKEYVEKSNEYRKKYKLYPAVIIQQLIDKETSIKYGIDYVLNCNELSIKLTKRDRKRLINYAKKRLYNLEYNLILAKMDVEFYEDKWQPKQSLIYFQRQLATIEKDIKMFKKIQALLEKEPKKIEKQEIN